MEGNILRTDKFNKDNQKTIVAFVVGLIIGGLLVWAFSAPADSEDNMKNDSMTEESGDSMEKTEGSMVMVGEGSIVVSDQPAGISVVVDSAEYPVSEGWIGVREYADGQLGSILGVNRFSASQNVSPTEIHLVRATTAGVEYAIVVFQEDGDFDFSLAGDAQVDTIFDTFIAQ